MFVAQGSVVSFTAVRPARLFGRDYKAGEEAHLVAVNDCHLEALVGRGGPWGWGGFRSRDLARYFRPATDADWK